MPVKYIKNNFDKLNISTSGNYIFLSRLIFLNKLILNYYNIYIRMPFISHSAMSC